MHRSNTALLIVTLLLGLRPSSMAAVPSEVRIQGVLLTQSGTPTVGPVDLVLELYDAETDGTQLWAKTLLSVPLQQGTFDVTMEELPADLFEVYGSVWLQTSVLGQAPLPRQRLLSAPYAHQARHADVASVAKSLLCDNCVGVGAIGPSAVTSAALATDAVKPEHVSFGYAGSLTKGGAAADVACDHCVAKGDVALNVELEGDIVVTGSLGACKDDGAGCSVKVSDAGGFVDNNDGLLNIQASGLRIRTSTNGGWAPLDSGPLAVHSDAAILGRLAVGGASGQAILALTGNGVDPILTAGGATVIDATGALVAPSMARLDTNQTFTGANTFEAMLRVPVADSHPFACGPTTKGALYVNTLEKALYFCEGSTWSKTSSGAAGNSALNPGLTCWDIKVDGGSAGSGLYWVDPDGGNPGNSFQTFCDMTTDGGGFMLLATNGDLAAQDCWPAINPAAAACGVIKEDLSSDWVMPGSQQANLSWSQLLFVTYGLGGYTDKLAYFGTDFGVLAVTSSERMGGLDYQPSITTTNGRIHCSGGAGYFYGYSLAASGSNPYPEMTKFFGGALPDAKSLTVSFHDVPGNDQQSGFDDYQDGSGCSDDWVPKAVRGERAAVLVRNPMGIAAGYLPKNTEQTAGQSCKAILQSGGSQGDGLYYVNPAGGTPVLTFCDMTSDGGGWTALTANGDLTADACLPAVDPGAGACGAVNKQLTMDWIMAGSQQAALSWSKLLFVSYGSAGYTDKLAYFAIDFGSNGNTAAERMGGAAFTPGGAFSTTYGTLYCVGGAGYVYGYSLTSTGSNPYPQMTKFFSGTAPSTKNSTLSFHDVPGNDQQSGVDDYQDGSGCSDIWVPQVIRGERAVVLVR